MTAATIMAANKKSTEELAKELKESGSTVMEAIQSSNNTLSDALNNLVLATVVAKDPALIETAKGLETLLRDIAQAGEDFKGSKINDLPSANEKLATAINGLANKLTKQPEKDYSKDFAALLQAINSKNWAPNIVVDSPMVSVPPVDLKPVADAIDRSRPTESIDLEQYKAQDLAGDDTFQYVGFVAPNGSWYIIENDIAGNSLRYKFGVKNYRTAWKSFNGHVYRLLNEAIREIQA